LVGDQQYLEDEPHITLYVGHLNPNFIREVDFTNLPSTTFEITGWETFRDDVVTGNHTLACRIESPGISDYQADLLDALRPYWTGELIRRFNKSYDRFDDTRRENLSEYGFPFVGSGWKPHLTIASIDPADFNMVRDRLHDELPKGNYEFASVVIYELNDNEMSEERVFKL
jgi:hypothetical protein